jgi:hypothetical protein
MIRHLWFEQLRQHGADQLDHESAEQRCYVTNTNVSMSESQGLLRVLLTARKSVRAD